MKHYVGNPLQIRGAERYALLDGKGKNMEFFYLRNGLGLEAWISVDRCADISRLSLDGVNMSYFGPCGYVAPAYYEIQGIGFLKSFTAGFFTTCGLTAAGNPCVDEGEELPLHGTISNTPSKFMGMEESDEGITLRFQILDARLSGRKLVLDRTYFFSYQENTFRLRDKVTNIAADDSPYMILYHCNMGYPLLDADAEVRIPNEGFTPRSEHAAMFKDSCLQMEQPQKGYKECCYYFDVQEKQGLAHAGIFNEKIQKGLTLEYDKKALPYFTEWKMMGVSDYVLGLEPGNCHPDGRDIMRKDGTLRFLKPEETGETSLTFRFFKNKNAFEEMF